MRSSLAVGLLAVLAVGAQSGCTQGPPATPAVDQAAIVATIDSLTGVYNAAVAARDTNALVNCYADDGRMLPSNAPKAEGKDAIRHAWVGFLSMPGMELSPSSTNKLISEAGDMVVDIGTYVLKWQDAKGKPMSDTGKYCTVLKKVNGEWKIEVETFNSDMPLPGM